ncbi:hypothetical protein GQ53DRAFT_849936 [Thozetella sp. PMI_491]|nr:hypothetical protein GQ53DRAFT_849936 [Thozetella sp. PMI_491]
MVLDLIPVGQLPLGSFLSGAPTIPIADFDTPPNYYRPKFRYWLPDASVPIDEVVQDIHAIADVGCGGVEFLPFFNYGNGPVVTDWSIYGFGTEAFKDVLRAALNASAADGLLFDFALGPNQGQGVPSEPETPGLGYQLVYSSTVVNAGETFNGLVPTASASFNTQGLEGWMHLPQDWGEKNSLAAVVAAEVVRKEGLDPDENIVVLNQTSVVDLTSLVRNGTLEWTPPPASGEYRLFAFYERYTNAKNAISVPEANTTIGNGSWFVDHFSATGAKKITDFWDQHLLDDAEVKRLLREVGEYSWEDSLEMIATLWWTQGFAERFEKSRGYSITPCLPVLYHIWCAWHDLTPYEVTYIYDTGEYGNTTTCTQDYREVLNEGYQEYLTHLEQWAQSLGLNHSSQPAYNLPLDMAAAVPFMGAPELESLAFFENIDRYRQFMGAAHLAGSEVISTEVGAISIGAYAFSVPELLRMLKGSFAVGVNTLVLHGYAYSGNYPGTTWPGLTTFEYRFTDMWGPRMPAWRHLNDSLLYAARNSLVGKLGVPKVDLAFYIDVHYYEDIDFYPGPDLTSAGYSHEYLGFANLAWPEAIVSDGLLAPDGPAYKALVVYDQTYITPEASSALVRFAQGGLPIFIVGSAPSVTVGAAGQAEVTKNMEELSSYPSVHTIPLSDFGPGILAQFNVTPRAAVLSFAGGGPESMFIAWRSDKASGVDTAYMWNNGFDSVFTVRFTPPIGSTPWILDAWTGKQSPLAAYDADDSGITIDVSLRNGQTKIFAFTRTASVATTRVVSYSSNIETVQYNSAGQVEALVYSDGVAATVHLSNGSRVTFLEKKELEDITVGPWDLTIESYVPLEDLSDAKGQIVTLPTQHLPTLVPWVQIEGMQNVSGVGTYVAHISIPLAAAPSQSSYAVLLSLGRVSNTIRAWVNERPVPPLDTSNAVADISDLVTAGRNEVRVEVSSTLFNAVKARIGSLHTNGEVPWDSEHYTDVPYAGYGLVGPVEVQFLRRVVIHH